MEDTIDKHISELQYAVTMAGLNYEIWWVYKERESRRRFVSTMNKYLIFFQISIHAHFVACLVALYRLYETREDTYNISRLLCILKETDGFSRDCLAELDEIHRKAKPLWTKVNILRNKAFGHRSSKLNFNEVFKEADVTPNQIQELIEHTKELLNKLSYEWNKSSHAFNLGSGEEARQLLTDLKEFHKSQSRNRTK